MIRFLRMTLITALILAGVVFAGFGIAFAEQVSPEAAPKPAVQNDGPPELVYQFPGVSDDGEQGSVFRQEATTVICTNISGDFVSVEVRVYSRDRGQVFTSTVDLIDGQTGTWSTQATEVYFEDVILDTDIISQGSGEIYSTDPAVICSVQVLDPFNSPPGYLVGLPLYDENGSTVGDISEVFIPAVKKNLPTN